MIAVMWRFISERKTSIIVTALGLAAMAWMLASIVPGLAKDQKAIQQFIDQSRTVMAFSTGELTTNFATAQGYLSAKYFSLWWLFIVGGYAVALGSAIVGREVGKGTAESLLAQPITRTKFLFSRILASMLINLLHIAVGVGVLFPARTFFHFSLSGKGILYMGLYSVAMCWLLLGLSLLLSLFIRERGRAISLTSGIFIVWHVMKAYTISSAKVGQVYQVMGKLSPLKYYNAERALYGKPGGDYLILFGLAAVLIVVSWMVFLRKDIAA